MNLHFFLGGSPVRTDPYPAWPIVEDRDVAAVADVIRSGRWGRLGATQVRETAPTRPSPGGRTGVRTQFHQRRDFETVHRSDTYRPNDG